MPPLIAAGVALAGTTIIGSVTVGTVLTTVALSAGSYLLNKVLADKPQQLGGSLNDEGQKVLSKQPVPVKRMILGRSLVGGSLFFLEVKPPYLYYGIVLASHEIDGIDEYRLGNTVVSVNSSGEADSTPYNDGTNVFYQVSVRNGTDDQLIDPLLAADFPELPSTFRQRGHATAVVKLRYGTDDDEQQQLWGSGEPEPRFLVRGAKVFDPRDPSQSKDDTSTWVFSDTASLCQAYWLNSPLGGNRPFDRIDLEALCVAADADDEPVLLLSGAYENRYSVNGVIDLSSEPHRVLSDLMTANLGRLTWSQGIYRITSGVPRPPVLTLNDNSARGAIQSRQNQARQDLINVVQTVFLAPERDFQLANGPEIRNSSYITADGEEHLITVQLPFTATHTRAQRIGKIVMELSRLGHQVSRNEFLGDAVLLSAADVVNIESDALPYIAGQYEIVEAGLEPTGDVKIVYEEYSASVYDWDTSDEQAFTIAPAELAGVS